MSKKCKVQGAAKRLKEKRARKSAMQAMYQKYKEQGRNSKRSQKKSKKSTNKTVSTIGHSTGPCGNPGCTKCFEINFNSFLHKGQPVGMPQWMFNRWMAEKA